MIAPSLRSAANAPYDPAISLTSYSWSCAEWVCARKHCLNQFGVTLTLLWAGIVEGLRIFEMPCWWTFKMYCRCICDPWSWSWSWSSSSSSSSPSSPSSSSSSPSSSSSLLKISWCYYQIQHVCHRGWRTFWPLMKICWCYFQNQHICQRRWWICWSLMKISWCYSLVNTFVRGCGGFVDPLWR